MAYHDDNEMGQWFKMKIDDERLQDQALRYSETIDPPYPIFAKECSVKGQRVYCVGSWKRMFSHVLFDPKQSVRNRMFYEMIMTGRMVKPYFDIELVHSLNPGADWSNFKSRVEELFRETMQEYAPHTADAIQRAKFHWYNASDANKYSYHLIVNIPGFALDSMFVCGRLALIMIYKSQQRGWTEFACKTILNKQVVDRHAIDVTVYSRNRNYRMEGHTKFGKERWLLTEERREQLPKSSRLALRFEYGLDHEEFFSGCCTHFYPDEINTTERLKLPWSDITSRDRKMADWMMELGYVKNILWGDAPQGPPPDARIKSGGGISCNFKAEAVPEELRSIVHQILSSVPLTMMSFTAETGNVNVGTVSHDCKIAGRAHTKNHVWYQLNFGRPRRFRGFRQQCHNLGCKSTNQPWTPLSDEHNAIVDAFWKTRIPADIPLHPVMQYMQPSACTDTNLKKRKRV